MHKIYIFITIIIIIYLLCKPKSMAMASSSQNDSMPWNDGKQTKLGPTLKIYLRRFFMWLSDLSYKITGN
jgi:hypothetical protein